MKRAAILIAMLLAVGASCYGSDGRATAQDQEDRSLTPDEYLGLGFPAIDRPWTASDYQAVFRAMQKLPIVQFPRTTSPKSRAVVDRLTNPENLELCRNKSLPLDQRFLPCLDLVDAASGISKIYLAAHSRTPSFAEDLIRMQGFMLRAVAVEVGLLDEFLPTLDKEDPSYPSRMAGLDQMKSGMAQMVQGALMTLEDRETFTAQSRAELASTLCTTFPTIASHLPPLSRKEFLATLRRIADEEKDASVKAAISKAIENQGSVADEGMPPLHGSPARGERRAPVVR